MPACRPSHSSGYNPLPTVPQSSGDSRLTTGRYSAFGRRQSYTFSPGVSFSLRRPRHLPLRFHSHAGSRRGRGPGGMCSAAACILRSEVAPGDRYSVTAVRHSPEVPDRAPEPGHLLPKARQPAATAAVRALQNAGDDSDNPAASRSTPIKARIMRPSGL